MMGDICFHYFFLISGQEEVGAARIKTETWNLDTFAKKWIMNVNKYIYFTKVPFFEAMAWQ